MQSRSRVIPHTVTHVHTLHVLLQDTWVKATLPLAHLLNVCGERVVQMIAMMEKKKKVVPLAFKVTEGLRDPEDYDTLVTKMLAMAENDRINPDRLRHVAQDLLRKRWWHWILLHPQMPDDKVHPSRSVHPLPVNPLSFRYPPPYSYE
jgi:hypothetical protein